MVSEDEKSKYMAFVHGELNDSDAVEIAKRIESDPEIRREIDQLSRASRQTREHFAEVVKMAPDIGLGADQILRIRTAANKRGAGFAWARWFGAALLAAAGVGTIALFTLREKPTIPSAPPLFKGAEKRIASDMTEPQGPAEPQEAANPPEATTPTEPTPPEVPVPETSSELKAANLDVLKKEMEPTAAVPNSQAAAPEAKAPVPPTAPTSKPESYARKARAKTLVRDATMADAHPERDKADDSPSDEDSGAIIRTFHVVSGQLAVSKGLNRAKVAQYLSKRMDRDQSCIPKDSASAPPGTEIRVKTSFSSKGKPLSVETNPKLPDTEACLKKRLAGKPDVFSSGTLGKVAFRLKIQGS